MRQMLDKNLRGQIWLRMPRLQDDMPAEAQSYPPERLARDRSRLGRNSFRVIPSDASLWNHRIIRCKRRRPSPMFNSLCPHRLGDWAGLVSDNRDEQRIQG